MRCLNQTIYSELAQLAEHLTVNQVVAGSSPAFGAKKNPRPIGLRVLFHLVPNAWALTMKTVSTGGALKNELSEGRQINDTRKLVFVSGIYAWELSLESES